VSAQEELQRGKHVHRKILSALHHFKNCVLLSLLLHLSQARFRYVWIYQDLVFAFVA